MLRTLSVGLCKILLRIFFRRIELVGRENIPRDGLVLFVLNHPSALIDPLFVLCLTGKKVSFLAKEPLFRMPFVGIFVKAFESLPVYRSQDGADPKKNRAMLDAARDLLIKGNAIALFPEGTSHSEPRLKPLRSGAARLALSTRAITKLPVYLVPGGLYYEQKQAFRSRALFSLGPPIFIPEVPLDEKSEPAPAEARAVTELIQQSIERVIPTAETMEGLSLSDTAERLFSAAVLDAPHDCPTAVKLKSSQRASPSLAERVERRTLFISAYQKLVQSRSWEVRELVEEILDLAASFSERGKEVDAMRSPGGATVGRRVLLRGMVLVVLFPTAALGVAAYAPAYYAVRFVALRYSSGESDITATVKLIAGALLFPLSWVVLVVSTALFSSSWAIAGALSLLLVVSAFSAVWFQDRLGSLLRLVRQHERLGSVPRDWQRLRARRAAVAEKIASILVEHGYVIPTDT